MDLVEVAPDSSPPVCRIMDYGRILYDQKRRAKDQRKKTRTQELKEIKVRPNTDTHDYQTKLNHASEFLEKGHKVKLTIMYRGREMAHYDRGTAMLRRFETDLAPIADVEAQPAQRGRTQSMVVAPKKKKVAKESVAASPVPAAKPE
ncbi:MAG: Translation initiation factor IF-3 [candidate division BRC1 bacterium ADurb.BinA364]|nr:MAG: Translation initiation factor IF-3 [candidate division BRC1 bacterium ADurb.BinA364]